MNVKIFAYRSTKQASIWFWDPLGVLLAMVFAGPLVFYRPLLALGALILISPWMTRIRITRGDPTVGNVTYGWGPIPLRRRTFDLRRAVSGHADDMVADPGGPHDEISAGDWSLHCRGAGPAVAWLRESSTSLSLPIVHADPNA